LFSFHGLPKRMLAAGDPYNHHCLQTGKLVADKLKLKEHQWQVVFQSRFGKQEWLQPYCAEVLKSLPDQDCKEVDIVCPGFSVDCLETLEEISIKNRQVFMDAGGERFNYIPALNDSTHHLKALADIITQHLD